MTDYEGAGDLAQLPDGSDLLTGLASGQSAPLIYSPWTLRLDENDLPLICFLARGDSGRGRRCNLRLIKKQSKQSPDVLKTVFYHRVDNSGKVGDN
jgi:hypothetical protein